MRPIWSISADGGDISRVFESRLTRLEIRDEAGVRSDRLQLTIDNRRGSILPPRHGAVLSVSLGFKETGLTHMGSYTVSKTRLTGPVRTIEVSAAAIDLRVGAKSPQTRGWDDVTLTEIAETIAFEHDLIPRVAPGLGGVQYDHEAQTGESDLHFLTRLADDLGGVVKVADGNLVIAPRAAGETVSGRTLQPVFLGPEMFTSWSCSDADRERHAACVAWWQDIEGGERRRVTIGDGEPAYELRRPFPTEEAAARAAEAKLSSLNRSGRRLVGSLAVANLSLAAEQPIIVGGLDALSDGRWSTTNVTHLLDGAFTTSFEAEIADGD